MQGDAPEVGGRPTARSGTDGAGARPAASVNGVFTALIVLGLVLWMLVAAFEFGAEARRLPLVVGTPLALLALINLGLEAASLLRSRREPGAPEQEPVGASVQRASSGDAPLAPSPSHQEGEQEEANERAFSLIGVLALLVVLVILALMLGVVVGGALFIVGAMRLLGRHAWWSTLTTALVLAAGMYALSNWFGAPMYEGLWEPVSLLLG